MSKSISVPMIHSLQVYLQLVSKSEVNGTQIEIEPKKIIKKKLSIRNAKPRESLKRSKVTDPKLKGSTRVH